MRKVFRRASALIAGALVTSAFLPAAPAMAHGEAAQEAWLRMGTIAFYDVEFNGQPPGAMDGDKALELKVNEEFTVTGKAKILETWPEQLDDPELGFINLIAPGPPVTITKRLVNGKPAAASILVEKGETFSYEFTAKARRVSQGNGWHVHVIFGIKGAGSLVGPGNYVKVTGSDGDYTNKIELQKGGTVDLERIGLSGVILFNLIWFALGMIWMIYWTVPKPTVTRLPVSLAVPLNSDGADAGLISKKDHQTCNIIMAVTLAILIGGFIWQANTYPDKIPLQVLRYKPIPEAAAAPFATATASEAVYTAADKKVELTASVTNNGETDAKITEYITGGYTFAAGDSNDLTLDGDTVAAGETKTVKMTLTSDIWDTDRLAPVGETRPLLTGVIRVADSGGNENFATVQTFMSLN
ncbi:MAG: methane monooxygenase/ammonia monooxygenase subunit B [Nocardioides sp.]